MKVVLPSDAYAMIKALPWDGQSWKERLGAPEHLQKGARAYDRFTVARATANALVAYLEWLSEAHPRQEKKLRYAARLARRPLLKNAKAA